MKINWKKLPSVTREGKFFYRGKHQDGTVYTIAQSFLSNQWEVSDSYRHCQFGQFKTAKAAMVKVESFPSNQ